MISFDHAPTVYWFLGYILAGVIVLSVNYKKLPDGAYLGLCIALLVFMRLPVIVFNRELNVDESQMLSHAITLFQDPVYWKSVDGTTIGPLDNYLLVLPKLFGFQINYTTGRIMGLLCAVGSVFFLFQTLKNWFGEATARIATLAPLFLLAFTQEVDFVHYSSEQLPVFLLSLAIWLLSRVNQPGVRFTANVYFIGLVAGIIPFAKLQAVPQAFVIAAAAFWFCLTRFQKSRNVKPGLFLLLGGLTFPAIVTLWTLSQGIFQDFINFYILGNIVYAGGTTFFQIPAKFARIFSLSADFQIFTLSIFVTSLAGILYLSKKRGENRIRFEISVVVVLLVVSSIYAVTKSGNDFTHYLNFCLIPWTLMAALATTRVSKWSLLFPSIVLIWFAGNDAFFYVKERMLNQFYSVNARTLALSPVVQELKKYSRKDDYMVVWGWQCAYYVEAQLAQGTAENHSERSIFEHSMRDTYRIKYLSDIKRTRPAFVLDAVGKNSSWLQNKTTQGVESYPELFQYIQMNYKLAGSFDDTRLYIRKDRLSLR